MEAPKTLLEAIKLFLEYENCRQFMILVRWADGVVRCPHCQSEKVTYLAKAKVYKCRTVHLKQKFSLKTGTVLEDSPIGLDKWLPAFWLLSNSKNGISSHVMTDELISYWGLEQNYTHSVINHAEAYVDGIVSTTDWRTSGAC